MLLLLLRFCCCFADPIFVFGLIPLSPLSLFFSLFSFFLPPPHSQTSITCPAHQQLLTATSSRSLVGSRLLGFFWLASFWGSTDLTGPTLAHTFTLLCRFGSSSSSLSQGKQSKLSAQPVNLVQSPPSTRPTTPSLVDCGFSLLPSLDRDPPPGGRALEHRTIAASRALACLGHR